MNEPLTTQARLQEAARGGVAASGFHNASVSAICRRAGLAHGTFYRYFSSKDDAFLSLIEQLESRLIGRLWKVIERGGSPEARLLGIYRDTLAFIDENVDLYQVFREAEFIHSEIPRRFYARVCDRLQEVLREGIGCGAFAVPDLEVAAYAVLGVILFLALRYIVWKEPEGLKRAMSVGADLLLIGVDPERGREAARRRALAISRLSRPAAEPLQTAIDGGQATRKALLWRWGEANPSVYYVAFSTLWLNLGGWIAIGPAATAVLFGPRHHARNYAVVFSGYGVGAILGTSLSGAIKDATGSFLPVFVPVMALAALGIAISLLGLKPSRS